MIRHALLFLFLFISSAGFLAFGQAQAQATGTTQASPATGYAIFFERFGGYAGWYDRFWIYPDGRIENEDGKVKEITPQAVTAFKQRVEPLLPPKTQEAQMWRSLCSDCYQYRITILADSGVRSIVLSEPLETKSDKLAQVTQELRDLLFGSRFQTMHSHAFSFISPTKAISAMSFAATMPLAAGYYFTSFPGDVFPDNRRGNGEIVA